MERLIAALSSSFPGESGTVIGPDAVLIVDDGGHGPVTPTRMQGRARVIGGLRELMAAGTTPTLASINGSHGITLARDGRVVGVITVQVGGGMLSTIWVVSNPEKLRHWNAG
ncbi:hypothetical protein ACFPJ2_11730 [Microbacterium suwonense]|uniref:hypothetical protein n=1 Tax=Microbacterium suwonense TaxID=683047 RepID=UPI0036200997